MPRAHWDHRPRLQRWFAIFVLQPGRPLAKIAHMSLHPGSLGGGITKDSVAPAAAPRVANDPERWVDEHGDVLYRYALARVRKPEVAQDLVQDTLLAAMRARDRFAGQSSVRSWL